MPRNLSLLPLSSSSIIEYPSFGRLAQGNLVARYKRFLADVKFDKEDFQIDDADIVQADGSVVVHCPNTGSMLSLLPESRTSPLACCVSIVDRNQPGAKKRKYRCTLEMVQLGLTWVGVHSALANKIVAAALSSGQIQQFSKFSQLNREVTVGDSKLDFEMLWKNTEGLVTRKVLLEVKSVTLAEPYLESDGSESMRAVFPDCVSDRATRHAQCLTEYQQRYTKDTDSSPLIETAILFLVQRGDCMSFSASDFDAAYRKALRTAEDAGVIILPYKCALDPLENKIRLLGPIPYVRHASKDNSVCVESYSPSDGGIVESTATGRNKKRKRL
jgi:sugar fermentation stimulation protein A